jgi:hypothetical protein
VDSGNQALWRASVTVVGYRPGDTVQVATCTSASGTNCGGGGTMTCSGGGNCTYSSSGGDKAKSTDYVKFTFSPASGSCSLAPLVTGPFGGSICP